MKKKKLAPLPRITTKTITVEGLLMKIRRLILDEPQRLDMRSWVSAFQGKRVDSAAFQTTNDPACGTVACMAGWGAVLLRPSGTSGVRLDNRAEEVLPQLVGFDDRWTDGLTVGGLFSANSREDFGEEEMPRPGTVKHARLIAKRIVTYLQQHPEVATRKIDVAYARRMLSE